MSNQERLNRDGARAQCRGRSAEFPSLRQSSSYFPIRGWHSLISHIITLVRGALRTLAGYARGMLRGRRQALAFPLPGCLRGDRFTATLGTDSLVAAATAGWRLLLLSEWTSATPSARANAKQPRATRHMFVRSFGGGLARCNSLLAA